MREQRTAERQAAHDAIARTAALEGVEEMVGLFINTLPVRMRVRGGARLGAWLCGRGAELAIVDGDASEESLLPSDLLDHLGAAFNELERGS